MNKIKMYALAFTLVFMAGCTMDLGDYEGEKANVLDPSKGFDNQSKSGLVYGKVTTSSGIPVAKVDISLTYSGGPAYHYGQGETDADGMYGVRVDDILAFTGAMYINATCPTACIPAVSPDSNIFVVDSLGEGDVYRFDFIMDL